jgi:quercetin dioxygenase-like cupin family protein
MARGERVFEFPEFLTRLPELDIDLPGVSGHILQGKAQQVAFVRFAQDTHVPDHSHAAQWEMVIEGEVDLTLEGEKRTYRAGESVYIPAGAVHAGDVKAGYRAVIFFDQADRYKTK